MIEKEEKGKLEWSEVKFWLNEAKSCEDRQKRELVQRNNYPFLINYYEGFEKIDSVYPYVSTSQTLSIINEYFPNTNAKISELMYQNPDIVVEALNPDMSPNENLMKSALMYGMEKSDMLIENRVALFDMLFAGYCAVEVDHIIEKDTLDLLPEESPQENGFIRNTINKFKNAFSDNEAEENVEKEIPSKEESFATSEKTYMRRWSPLNIPLDWKADVLKDRRYNLKKIEISKAEFNVKYPDFKEKVFPTDNKFDFAAGDDRDHTKKIILYEFQIKKKQNKYTTIIISPQYANSEIDIFDRQYPTNGFNVKIGTLHKYGKLYPVSFAQINKKISDEMNHYIRFIMEVSERNIPKFVIDSNKIKEDGETSLRSANVNDIVSCKGNTNGVVTPLQPTQSSPENKQLFDIFDNQTERLWAQSRSKLGAKSESDFAADINIQEEGFRASQLDIQEGLRLLIKEETETFKDIIVSLWDGDYFFKVTGGPKPDWYMPKKVINPITNAPMTLNSLTDILTSDFDVKIDITSSLRPNKEKRKKDFLDYITWLFSPEVAAYLQSQGKTINIEFLEKTAIEFGFNPKNVFVDLGMAGQIPEGEGMTTNPAVGPANLQDILKGGAV